MWLIKAKSLLCITNYPAIGTNVEDFSLLNVILRGVKKFQPVLLTKSAERSCIYSGHDMEMIFFTAW